MRRLKQILWPYLMKMDCWCISAADRGCYRLLSGAKSFQTTRGTSVVCVTPAARSYFSYLTFLSLPFCRWTGSVPHKGCLSAIWSLFQQSLLSCSSERACDSFSHVHYCVRFHLQPNWVTNELRPTLPGHLTAFVAFRPCSRCSALLLFLRRFNLSRPEQICPHSPFIWPFTLTPIIFSSRQESRLCHVLSRFLAANQELLI